MISSNAAIGSGNSALFRLFVASPIVKLDIEKEHILGLVFGIPSRADFSELLLNGKR